MARRVILRDRVLEVRNVDQGLHMARKPKRPDEWDPPSELYDLDGPGQPVSDDAEFVSADDFLVTRNTARPLRITRLS